MIPDPHDPRTFRHYAKVDEHGNVLAIVEVASGQPAPTDATYRDVTETVVDARAHRPAPKVDDMK